VDVQITQFNVQLYFKEPVLNTDKLNSAFSSSEGFSATELSGSGRHPMQNTMSFFRECFKIGAVQSNALPFRILQVMSYPNVLKNPEAETIACLRYVAASLKQHLDVNVGADVYAMRVVFHSIVTGSGDHALSKLSTIENVPTLAGKYDGHKNPMDAIQLTTRTGSELSQKFWSDIRISQFQPNSYVATIFNETDSFAGAVSFIEQVKQFVATLMQEIESAASK
jgi:hypothetical protein